MGWHDRIVYHRDFAYSSPRSRMAHGSIGHVPAATYAEYVQASSLLPPNGAYPEGAPTELSSNAPASAPASCIALRPGLAHRLYSHQLHVRAKAKLQRDRLLSGQMIDIYVGQDRRHWSLHRNLLCHHSELLEAELEGNEDGSNRKDTLDLPDYDPAGFELLVKWLYQGKLDDVSDMADANQKYDFAVGCYHLYLLCDRLDMPQLKNVAMDQYRKGLNEAELVPDAEEIDQIYRKSPQASPFKYLMTRIAARQIMDPDSDRDVETYRQCFQDNPDFAIDLVKAIRLGSGGVLFEDPTEPGNECEYHDHENGPSCHLKGKGKTKQVFKTTPAYIDQLSSRSTPSTNSGQRSPPPLLSHPKVPRRSPPRQARLQDGINVGPLRRRLTSPASSTVGTSKETAVVKQPSNPDMTAYRAQDREKLRRVTSPERQRRLSNQRQAPAPRETVPVDLPQNSEDDRQQQDKQSLDAADREEANNNGATQRTPTKRGIWEWARAGTGRLNIIGRIPHPEWKGPVPSRVNGDFAAGESPEMESIQEVLDSVEPADDHEPDSETPHGRHSSVTPNHGLGIRQADVSASPSFAQTKMSSDELLAGSSTTSTPAKLYSEVAASPPENGTQSSSSKESRPSTPDTPTPHHYKSGRSGKVDSTHMSNGVDVEDEESHDGEPKHSAKNGSARKTESRTPRNEDGIPTYKIALTSSVKKKASRLDSSSVLSSPL